LYKKYNILLSCFVLITLTTTAQKFFGTVRKEPLNSFLLNGLQASMEFLRAKGFDTLKNKQFIFEACFSKIESHDGEWHMACEAADMPVEEIRSVRYAFTYRPMGDTLASMYIEPIYMSGLPVSYATPRDSNMLRLATALKNNTLAFGISRLRKFIAQKKIRHPRIAVHFFSRATPDIADQFTWFIMTKNRILYTLDGRTGKPIPDESFSPPVIKPQ
jgi:hypothetical protein